MKKIKKNELDSIKDIPIALGLPNYKELKKCKIKNWKKLHLNICKQALNECLKNLEIAITEYGLMYHHTEYWEKNKTYEFDFENWNRIKKVIGHITRYYNDIKLIERSINDFK